MNVKHDALKDDSWAERQMDKDADGEGVVVRKQCLTCSVSLSDIFSSCLKKTKRTLKQTEQFSSETDGLPLSSGVDDGSVV